MTEVCAIVVTYHPDALVPGNLAVARPQVGDLVVVDNGSNAEELRMLRRLAVELDFQLIENGENLGIASALNIGVRWAQAKGAEFVLLFDQDSCAGENMVRTLVESFRGSPWGDRLGILVPRYVDRRFGVGLHQNAVATGIEAAMTSGSLIRTGSFARFGLFVDELFIDGVDYEFSLRMRREGLIIGECPQATLLHSPGEPIQHKLFGRKIFQNANYSPLRIYYQQRNKIWVTKRYFWTFPIFCSMLFFYSTKDLLKMWLGEPEKGLKTRFFLRGVLDGLRGRMGKFTA